jgi:hypothetical protein
MKVMSLELNEINFDFVKKYVAQGYLPNFKAVLDDYFFTNTISEKEYQNLEPWVTVYTGKTYAEHGVFRLGDSVLHNQEQVWESIERETGEPVVIFSPMNAPNRVGNKSVFNSATWTTTPVTENIFHKLAYSAIRQAVNENATKGASLFSMIKLAIGLIPVLGCIDYRQAFRYLKQSRREKWFKAILLDYLLFELFSKTVDNLNPVYYSLFLNAGAHIQHNYMFDSKLYGGVNKKPAGYRAEGLGLILEIYSLYDVTLGKALKKYSGYRILLTTGLSQRPNPEVVYYYRPNRHAKILSALGLDLSGVIPGMSRDMLISFDSPAQRELAIELLQRCVVVSDSGSSKLFSLEVRENAVFCQVIYTQAISDSARVVSSKGEFGLFHDHFSHVSIENGIHRTLGFILDTGRAAEEVSEPLQLPELNKYVKTLSFG